MFDRQGQRKYLNGRERRACLDVFQAESDLAYQALGLTLLHTGCRISEALNLTAKDIDFSQKCVVFETLKRRERGLFRAVPIPDSLIKLLSALVAEAEPTNRIWPICRVTAYRMIKRRMTGAGIKGTMACPKGLRHGFAIACIAQKVPLTTVQKWLGHALLETTAIYLNVSGDEERTLARRLWKHLKN